MGGRERGCKVSGLFEKEQIFFEDYLKLAWFCFVFEMKIANFVLYGDILTLSG